MEITIHLDRIWYVAISLTLYCIALDIFIWRMNHRWTQMHPNRPRHPYSPLFTALGNLALIAGLGALTNWQAAAVMLVLNIIFGGIMWRLHARRWMFRS